MRYLELLETNVDDFVEAMQSKQYTSLDLTSRQELADEIIALIRRKRSSSLKGCRGIT